MVAGLGADVLRLARARRRGRTDAELREPVAELTARLGAIIEQTFRELFPAPAGPNPFYDVAPRFAFALLDGLALERIHADGPDSIPRCCRR
jgi:hypothetical protein